MSIFYHEQAEPPNPSKRCKFLAACLPDAFSNCHVGRRLPTLSRAPAEECPTSDFDEEHEVIVSAIRSAAVERLRHKSTTGFSFVYSSASGDLFLTQKGVKKKGEEDDDDHQEDQDNEKEEFLSASGDLFITQKGVKKKGEEDDDDHQDDQDNEKEEFLSIKSRFSCCSSSVASSRDAFVSVKTSLSRCSSLNGIEFIDFPRQSIIQQFCHCEGWPFGLCRKALLLPPLPKSPSESWTWRRKGTNKYAKLV